MIEEIFFWKREVVSRNNRFLFDYSIPQIIVYTDASGVGCGAWATGCGGMVLQRNWREEEMGKSSTWRELRAVQLSIQAFAPKLR